MTLGKVDPRWEDELAKDVVLDHFGDVAASVVATLQQRGEQTFSEVHRTLARNDAALPAGVLRRTLAVLIQHGIVTFATAAKGDGVRCTYRACSAAAVRRLRFPRLVLAAGDVGGRVAEMVLEVLLECGIATVARIVGVVCERLAAAAAEQDGALGADADYYSQVHRRRDADEALKAMKRLIAATYVVRAVKDSVKQKPGVDVSSSSAGAAAAGASNGSTGMEGAFSVTATATMSQPLDTGAELPPELHLMIQQNNTATRSGRAPATQAQATQAAQTGHTGKRGRKGVKRNRGVLDVDMLEAEGREHALSEEALEEERVRRKKQEIDRAMAEDTGFFDGEIALPAFATRSEAAAAAAATAAMTGNAVDAGELTFDRMEEDSLWTVNFAQFDQKEREGAVLGYVGEKINKTAAYLYGVMLKLSRDGAQSFTAAQLLERVREQANAATAAADVPAGAASMDLKTLNNYLELMCKDASKMVARRVNPHDPSFVMYAVQIESLLATLHAKYTESVIAHRFGARSLRIYRMLGIHKMLEQKQIAELGMLNARETRERLFGMYAAGVLTLTEFPKGANGAATLQTREAKSSFFLWGVNEELLARIVYEEVCHATLNLRLRAVHEVAAAYLLVQKAEYDRAQPPGAAPLLSAAEQTQLDAFLARQDRLEASVLALSHFLLALQNFNS